jgi:hypothetical protein
LFSDDQRNKGIELKEREREIDRDHEETREKRELEHQEIRQERELLYILQDEIKKQKREMFTTRKQNDSDWLNLLEEEMNGCIKKAEAIEVEIRRLEVVAVSTIEIPVRRNTSSQR